MSIWAKTLYKGQSQFNGEVKVVENSGVRRLVAAGFTQSQTLRADGRTGLHYWDSLVPEDLELEADARVLILGLGAGTVAKIITHRFGPIAIDGVEIDPLMVELGQKYFSLDEPNVNIIIADAAYFVKEARFKYDLVCLDIFMGGVVPKEFESEEFFTDVRELLKDNGVLAINKIFSGQNELRAFEEFVKKTLPVVHSMVVRGNPKLDNVIVYAQKGLR
jgi:spermidine synthase